MRWTKKQGKYYATSGGVTLLVGYSSIKRGKAAIKAGLVKFPPTNVRLIGSKGGHKSVR